MNLLYESFNAVYFLTVTMRKECILPQFLSNSKRWNSMDHNISLLIDDNRRVFSLLRLDEDLEQSVCYSSEYDNSKRNAQVVVHIKTGW